MIRNESEYRKAVQRVKKERSRLSEQEKRLRKEGLSGTEVSNLLNPFRSFHLQLQEEVESYERLRRGELGELQNLQGLGQTLVAARIALGLTQRELARRLGVHESQVSRDERNDYHGITVERATKILEALCVLMRSSFDTLVQPRAKPPATARRDQPRRHAAAPRSA